MAHVKELEKQFNELGLLYDEAALTDMTPEQTKEIKGRQIYFFVHSYMTTNTSKILIHECTYSKI
jgi:imidazoleglycerol phosphate synthase glutamine amidotransferase subunit HisH